jgi:hypothetical protein
VPLSPGGRAILHVIPFPPFAARLLIFTEICPGIFIEN